MARTREEFNAYIEAHSGDPWKIDSTLYHRQACVSFLRQLLGDSRNPDFVEFGAFNGAFTKELKREFAESSIDAYEISDLGAEQFRHNLSSRELVGVRLHVKDMMEFSPSEIAGKDPVILLIEVLYYLERPERLKFLQRVRADFPESLVCVSCPIVGGKYFSEQELTAIFSELGYRRKGFQVINLRAKDAAQGPLRPLLGRPFRRLTGWWLRWLCQYSERARLNLAHQVVYAFAPMR